MSEAHVLNATRRTEYERPIVCVIRPSSRSETIDFDRKRAWRASRLVSMTSGPAFSPHASPAAPATQGFASPLAQTLQYAPPPPIAPAAAHISQLPAPSRRGRAVSIWLFGVLAFALVALAGYFLTFLGGFASGVGLVLALIPLAIVLVGVYLIDRWEPEPRSVVAFALAWGAIAAVGLTLIVDFGFSYVVPRGPAQEVLSTVVQAPIVEEFWKGLGIVLILLLARRAFDGPVDGVVYGALVGAGFAFTENIQYFAISLIEGGGADLTVTFFMRGILSPFAHAMFTAVTGFAIGLAVRRGVPFGGVLGAGVVGLIGAIALHALWNGSAMFGDFLPLYFVLQVPLFVGFIFVIVMLRREEVRLTQERLSEYAAAGWFTPEEVTMLATPAGRRSGLSWAATLREDRRPLMRAFIKDAADLAAVRQRALTGRDELAVHDEQALLKRLHAIRNALLAY